MITWYWAVLFFFLGAIFGMFLACILAAGRRDDER